MLLVNNMGIGVRYMKNIVIRGTGVYIPTNEVDNEQLDKHFEKCGLSVHSLMEHLGRKNDTLFQKVKIQLRCVKTQLRIVS